MEVLKKITVIMLLLLPGSGNVSIKIILAGKFPSRCRPVTGTSEGLISRGFRNISLTSISCLTTSTVYGTNTMIGLDPT